MTVDQARCIAGEKQCSLGDIVNGTKLRQGLPSRQDLGEGGFCRADGEIGGVAIETGAFGKDPSRNRPRRNAVDTDAFLTEFDGCATGQVNNRGLRDAVIDTCEPGAHPIDACGVDDAAASLPSHDRNGMLRSRNRPAEMDRHRRIKGLEVEIGDPSALRGNAGIVE
jgi:hypothetical protein